MTEDAGRIVPPHGSGPSESAQKVRPPFAYPGRNPYANDPDETEGRRLYRGLANAEARRQIAHERHRARLVSPAQGIDARSDATACGRDPKDESPVAESDAPK